MMTVVKHSFAVLRSVELRILARNAVPGIPYLNIGADFPASPA